MCSLWAHLPTARDGLIFSDICLDPPQEESYLIVQPFYSLEVYDTQKTLAAPHKFNSRFTHSARLGPDQGLRNWDRDFFGTLKTFSIKHFSYVIMTPVAWVKLLDRPYNDERFRSTVVA